ncbi:hypothetical protein C8R46DRAFT_1000256 [Mycena filopes]|nr:hypothetical protein C8R46DRAFT_1000256 [Mycena filopes]
MLKGVVDLTESQRAPRKGVPTHPCGFHTTLDLHDGRVLNLGETIFQFHELIGRGTCVCRAILEEEDVVVKWTWPAKGRTAEATPVRTATDLATSSGDTWVLNHLPNILHAEQQDFEDEDSQCRSSDHLDDDVEPRVLRILVQEELFPITDLTIADEFSQAFYGIFKCYRWVYEKAHLMHRDISRNNLMFRRINGKVCGVLNDFDLAVIKTDMPLSTSNHRTGTAAYMALDLLKSDPPPPHIVRFDLESLYYVFAYIVCQYHDGKKIDDPPFQEWNHLPLRGLYVKKFTFIHDSLNVPQTPKFVGLRKSTVGLHRMFRDAFQARVKAEEAEEDISDGPSTPPPPFDNETLGNHITFDTFERILTKHLPTKCR